MRGRKNRGVEGGARRGRTSGRRTKRGKEEEGGEEKEEENTPKFLHFECPVCFYPVPARYRPAGDHAIVFS